MAKIWGGGRAGVYCCCFCIVCAGENKSVQHEKQMKTLNEIGKNQLNRALAFRKIIPIQTTLHVGTSVGNVALLGDANDAQHT
jgi:hypothetical protein